MLFLDELLRDVPELPFLAPLDLALLFEELLLDFAALLRVPEELLFLALVPALFDLLLDAERLAFAPLERDELLLPPLEDEDPPSSIGHLPDITRCAASATASAMSAPSFVALDMTDVAALLVVSAASIPASLIALRALGLALIAAAAAARPAASISLLIAALATLSIVELFELDDLELDDPELGDFEPEDLELEDRELEDFEPVFFFDVAIAQPPFTLANRHMNAATVPLRPRKGTAIPPFQRP